MAATSGLVGTLWRHVKRITRGIAAGIFAAATWILSIIIIYLALRVVEFFAPDPALSVVGAFALLAFLEAFLILVHELGHAATAWLLGWRVRDITVLRLTYRPLAGVWAWNQKRKNLDVGGWVFSTPPEAGPNTLHSIAISAGGPFANVAFAVLCLGYIAVFPVGSDPAYYLLQITGWLSLATGALNLIPVKLHNGLKSDGSALASLVLRLMRPEKSVSKQFIVDRLIADLNDGLPPFEGDLLYLDKVWDTDGKDAAELENLLLVYAIIEGNLDRARRVLARRQARGNSMNLDEKALLALASVLIDADATSAKEQLDSIEPWKREDHYPYWRSLAALEHLCGDRAAALTAVQTARALSGTLHQGLDEDEEAILRAIETGTVLRWNSDLTERRKRFLAQRRRPRL